MFFLTFFWRLSNNWQTLRSPLSTVSKPNFAKFNKIVNTRLKALDEIYKIYTLLHLGTPIWKPRKTLLASVLRTKLTAPETKPSGRSEAARPRGVAKRRCTMHAALTVRVGAALSQKIYACDAKHVPRWCNKHSALQEWIRTVKYPSFLLFRDARLLPFYEIWMD